MQTYCECGTLHDPRAAQTRCLECGTVGCRSCAMEVDRKSYCRWCAAALTAAVA